MKIQRNPPSPAINSVVAAPSGPTFLAATLLATAMSVPIAVIALITRVMMIGP